MNANVNQVQHYAGLIFSAMPSNLASFFGIYKARIVEVSSSDNEAVDHIASYNKLVADSVPSGTDDEFLDSVRKAVFNLCAQKVVNEANSHKLALSVLNSFTQAGFSISKVSEHETAYGVYGELTISLNKKAFSIVVNKGDGSSDSCIPCQTRAVMDECFSLLRKTPGISEAFERYVFLQMSDFNEQSGSLIDDSFEFKKPILLSESNSFFLAFLIYIHSTKKFFDKLNKSRDKKTHFFSSEGMVRSYGGPDSSESRNALMKSPNINFESFVFPD